MMSQTECYVCHKPGEETFQKEIDGRIHVFYVHKRIGKGRRPKKCDAGYKETEIEFMDGLEESKLINTTKNATKIEKKRSEIVPESTTEVFVKMFMHTCQKCSHTWVTKKQFPLVCSKCTSRTWNMTK